MSAAVLPTAHPGATVEEWVHFDIGLGLTADLLPVVSNTQAVVSANSALKEIGKVPSRYNRDRQVVGFPNWTQHQASGKEIERWSSNPDYGICLQTRLVRAIDVDITDAAEAGAVRAVIAEHVMLPVRRRGNAAKFLVAFQLEGAFTKRKFKAANGIVEFLATGQQFIAIGTHPSGVRYEWDGGLPDAFPVLTPEQFEALWKALVDRFAIEAPTESNPSQKATKLAAVHENDPLAQYLHSNDWVRHVERDGRLHITCPWASEHTSDSGDSATVYWPAHTGGFEHGGFKCLHAHCEGRGVVELRAAVGFVQNIADDFEVLPPEEGTNKVAGGAATLLTATDLLGREFSPISWVIPEILPEGAFLLVASPKIGKSWLALQMALAVASGTEVLGQVAAKGAALYLALEDNPRRLQARLKALDADLLLSDAQGAALQFQTEWPRVDQGGAESIASWLQEHPDARLVIIDVLERFRAPRSSKGNLYAEDYGALKAVKGLADAHHVTIVVVHHTRKGAADDPLAMVSGTQGLAGSADGMLLLNRQRGEARGSLHVIGRDVESDGEFVVEFADCRWTMVGSAKEVASTLQRQQVLDALNDAGGPLTAAELADATGKKRTTVARLLTKMVNEGIVEHNGPRYSSLQSHLAVE